MTSRPAQLDARAFEPVLVARDTQRLARPSQSYWQDAWRRLLRNTSAVVSLAIIVALGLFTLAGPWLWRVDGATQDVERSSEAPSLGATALVVPPYAPWQGQGASSAVAAGAVPDGFRLAEPATTQAVRLVWNRVPAASGYRVYRNILPVAQGQALGLPLAEIVTPDQASVEDRLDLKPQRYWYAVVALDQNGNEGTGFASLVVDPVRAISAAEAETRGWVASAADAPVGSTIALPYHPLGTDYLGRDMLARLMQGARVSLFMGVVAPLLYVLLGIVYGSTAGFVGGRVDQILMRTADFVVALPFLLFMILLKIAFGVGPGQSGVLPMLVALVVLSWPSTARLVRGQILQIRQEGYVAASRLLGARTPYLVFRHMIPNTMGVILVTLTFAVPSTIFTEAFLSFIGMGVVPPTPSWGSMCNEGIRTMLTHPHELIFPAVFISVVVLAFNLLGDGLRDALDVRLRGRE